MRDHEHADDHQPHQPEPRRQRGHNSSAIKNAERREVEQVQEKSCVGEPSEQRVVGHRINAVTARRPKSSKHRAADGYVRLNPGVAWRFLQRDDRAHKRNENRRADLQSEPLRRQQMPAFVNEDQ